MDKLDSWLKQNNFDSHPFALAEAEQEGTSLEDYFYMGKVFEEIWRSSRQRNRTQVVWAGRGQGKSACRSVIQMQCRPQYSSAKELAVPFVDFARLSGEVGLSSTKEQPLLIALARSLCTSIAHDIDKSPTILEDFPSGAKNELLSLLTSYETPDIRRLRWKRSRTGQADLPALLHDSEPVYQHQSASIRDHVLALVGLAVDWLGIDQVVVLVDEIDEWYTPDQTQYAEVISPLMGDLSLLQNTPGMCFKFFLPPSLRHMLQSRVRLDRIPQYELLWDEEELMSMLTMRLRAYSRNRVSHLQSIADEEIGPRLDRSMVRYGRGSPRNLIRLGDLLFRSHVDRESEVGSLLCEADLSAATDRFFRLYGTPPLHVDWDKRAIYVGDACIADSLTPQEFDIVQELVEARGAIVSRERISLMLYNQPAKDSIAALDSVMSRLRRKIEPNPTVPIYLITERGRGFRLAHLAETPEHQQES